MSRCRATSSLRCPPPGWISKRDDTPKGVQDPLIYRFPDKRNHSSIRSLPPLPFLARLCCSLPAGAAANGPGLSTTIFCLFPPRCREGGSEGPPALLSSRTELSEHHDSLLPCRTHHRRNRGLTPAVPNFSHPGRTLHPVGGSRSPPGSAVGGGSVVALTACPQERCTSTAPRLGSGPRAGSAPVWPGRPAGRQGWKPP